ncbi:hypothetical protein BpHYR1_033813 [Brachionus plicatilis]|uniref:Uncharacterized protein n=1 Tax=Brachionus plicatilis TaxID=10195 RepID=A0A3M7PHG5_BRAPC|nr:hypothetical protein BpHYR1_033813 [Brachionus plicatilis]
MYYNCAIVCEGLRKNVFLLTSNINKNWVILQLLDMSCQTKKITFELMDIIRSSILIKLYDLLNEPNSRPKDFKKVRKFKNSQKKSTVDVSNINHNNSAMSCIRTTRNNNKENLQKVHNNAKQPNKITKQSSIQRNKEISRNNKETTKNKNG